jgi:signal transduction histidine kinase
MKLREWFNKYHNRPLKIAASFLIAVWFVFAYRSYADITQKQELAATQTADLVSLAISSKDRTMTESLLEALVMQSGASSASVCEGTKQFLSANQDFSGCGDKGPRFKTVVEREISGSGELRLRVTFDWFANFAPSITLLVFGLVLVAAGFYFIQTAQRQIERGILAPLMNKLFNDDDLEIDELNELRENIRKVQAIEAQKAVALAIEEHNQQVAHDIRSPIAALNELLKLVPIGNLRVRSALEKAMERANAVANDLLVQESDRAKISNTPSNYDLAAMIQGIATEKRPLFLGGAIELLFADRLLIQTRLPQTSLARILSNIIDNAMTACTDRKHICITAVKTDRHVEISVKDTGVGITQETLERIGEKGFSFLKKSNGAKGTGRGVYQAKQSLSDVGGSIEFSSVAGKGTTVVLRVPVQNISVELSPMDFILVDNDDLDRMTWGLIAADRGRVIKFFSSIDELKSVADIISREVPIFLDSHLGDGMRGQDFAPKLRKMGFKRIYITTNYADLHGAELPDVNAVIEKSCELAMSLVGTSNTATAINVSYGRQSECRSL